MSLEQIKKLEELSRQARNQSEEAVAREQMRLDELEQQSTELAQFNHDYQHGVVGSDSLAPCLLAHRRAFVSRLTDKLAALKEERVESRQALSRRMAENKRNTAQHSAIETVHQQRAQELEQRLQRLEQQQMDDAYRGSHQILKHSVEVELDEAANDNTEL